MISSLSLRQSARDTEIVLPQHRDQVLALIAKHEVRQEGAVQAFVEETNFRVQLAAVSLTYVADNLNLDSPFESPAA